MDNVNQSGVEEPPFQDTNGRFAKGHKQRGGKKKGEPNFLTSDIRRGILSGAIDHGFDGNGLNGFPGYCRFLATHHPAVYATLPDTKGNVGDGDDNSSVTINILTVPSGHHYDGSPLVDKTVEIAATTAHDLELKAKLDAEIEASRKAFRTSSSTTTETPHDSRRQRRPRPPSQSDPC